MFIDALLLLNSSCSEKLLAEDLVNKKEWSASGKVKDKLNFTKLSDVVVLIKYKDFTIASTTTNSKGEFSFNLELDKDADSLQIDFIYEQNYLFYTLSDQKGTIKKFSADQSYSNVVLDLVPAAELSIQPSKMGVSVNYDFGTITTAGSDRNIISFERNRQAQPALFTVRGGMTDTLIVRYFRIDKVLQGVKATKQVYEKLTVLNEDPFEIGTMVIPY